MDGYKKYGPIVFAAIILYFSYRIVRPFIGALAAAAIIVYIFYPVYNQVLKKVKKDWLAALLMTILVFFIVFLPSVILINALARQIPTVYLWATDALSNSQIQVFLTQLHSQYGIEVQLNQVVQSLATSMIRFTQNFITKIPSRLVLITLLAFFLYYFFKDGKKLSKIVINNLPFSKANSKRLVKSMRDVTDGVIYGQLITALVQAVLSTIAYYVLGIQAPLVWGLLTLITSIIPLFGPFFVYLPLGVSMILGGLAGNSFDIVKGIILLIYGFGVVSSVDNFVKPLLISGKVRIHPGLVLLGIFGGLAEFGVMGIVIGPLILAFLISLARMYKKGSLFA